MSMKKILFAMAAAVSLFASESAQAAYSYTTSLRILNFGENIPATSTTPPVTSLTSAGTTVNNTTTNNTATFGGTTITLSDVSRSGFFVPGANTVNIGDISVTSTTPVTAGDTFTVTYLDTFTLTNQPPPGSPDTGSFQLSGTLTLTAINTGNGTVFNVYNNPTAQSGPLGGVTFSGSVDNFSSPTVNGSPGNFGGTLTANFIPEPASIVMLGLGLGGIGLVGFRRYHVQA